MKDAAAEYNAKHKGRLTLGRWRALYLIFIEHLGGNRILEVGAGSPEFLVHAQAQEKYAIDVGDQFAAAFEAVGVRFYQLDLDMADVPRLRDIDIVVCSDVFEHLRFPMRTLQGIRNTLSARGVVFSHVPNEFLWTEIAPILRGKTNCMLGHNEFTEWDNPHLRRFTDVGYRHFLSEQFEYNLKISEFYYRKLARYLTVLGMKPPYCMEPGPTYVSTNSVVVYRKLTVIKSELMGARRSVKRCLRRLRAVGVEKTTD